MFDTPRAWGRRRACSWGLFLSGGEAHLRFSLPQDSLGTLPVRSTAGELRWFFRRKPKQHTQQLHEVTQRFFGKWRAWSLILLYLPVIKL